jgi:hypothetical protein
MAQANTSNEFDAAKTIVDTLKGLDRPQQERAIRFASEALGLSALTPPPNLSPTPLKREPSPNYPSVLPSEGRPVDIKQFTDSKAPKSDQQFAAVVAYYYQFEAPTAERKATINASVLADAARLTARRRPTRFALTNAKNQGYLDAVGSGDYKINTVGENLVAITLPGNAGEAAPARSKSKPKKRTRSKAPTKKTGKRR